ncbi:hypothetical protein HF1_06920 [Mycoplasma haemofelis str. Langford 1]|uniref:Uncharacterized protein n=2 Tax=Mycoplasma haemofelis TaxID=29501 RepID=F6FII6_MYCHI|nr:hypothetical protein [Mycoplasma haemofelis]AEG73034.1 hypothetical protein MHF_0765 [Mycoplasma haemofelis Ohio2]CBY92700.1 hypothetical protein HF1_06920 [Mycoplasma haemofelis str. Langford 1]
MKILGEYKKQSLRGGARRGSKRAPSKASTWTKVNNGFYHAGLISIASSTSIANLSSSVVGLVNKATGNYSSYEEYSKFTSSRDSIRPSFRFANTYWNSSMNFGMPWYY